MPSAAFFHALWGTTAPWEELLPRLKSQGFSGIEASLSDVGYPNKQQKFLSLLDKYDLSLIVGVYTGWVDYIGECPPEPSEFPDDNKQAENHPTPAVASHLSLLRTQLEAAITLGPRLVHINVHGGSDTFSSLESHSYFSLALPLIASIVPSHIPVSHETHRGRILSNPFGCIPLFRSFPNLNITLDISHWFVVCERLLVDQGNDPRVEALMRLVVERTRHVHARVGTAQRAQAVELLEDQSARAPFEKVWLDVWKSEWVQKRGHLTVTPEYGPREDGYFVPSVVFLGGQSKGSPQEVRVEEVVATEMSRLKNLFK
ncbi:hypothetical protein BJ742DRAFT_808585 [Cladochytrium replicatum]|nr:hypothetical protein BJ742DRAFT_808585 [Cladochytrium replicatum]